MLKSLRLLGNEHEAKALYDCLSRIYDEEQGSGERNISERTFRFWHDAASVH